MSWILLLPHWLLFVWIVYCLPIKEAPISYQLADWITYVSKEMTSHLYDLDTLCSVNLHTQSNISDAWRLLNMINEKQEGGRISAGLQA